MKPFLSCVFFIILNLVILSSAGCNSIEDKPSWDLNLEGARNETFSQKKFERGAADKCHGLRYVDEQGNIWEGISLWLLVGRIDDDNKHGDGAFNDLLADKGYEIEVSSIDHTVKFTSKEIKRNNDIIVANKLNNASIPDEMAPLVLVGSGVNASRLLENITSIKLIFLPQK